MADPNDDDTPTVRAEWQALAYGSVKTHPMYQFLRSVEDFVTLHPYFWVH